MIASIVVLTCRRPAPLRRCLKALVAQRMPPGSFEVIVADDAAERATASLVAEVSADKALLRYVPVRGGHGPAAARNAGWLQACTDFLAFTDDDCMPQPDWLARGLAALATADAAWGTLILPPPAQRIPTEYQRNARRLEDAVFATANCFCRRQVLEAVGGFDERFLRAWREDSDLYFSLLEEGYRVVHEPRAVVAHPIRQAEWGVSLRQQCNHLYEPLLYKKHRLLYRRKIALDPPWDYYGNAAALAAAAAFLAAGWTASGLAALALWMAGGAVFALQRLRGTSKSPRHVAEMAFTSLFIPAAAVYWRLQGALQFRVRYL